VELKPVQVGVEEARGIRYTTHNTVHTSVLVGSLCGRRVEAVGYADFGLTAFVVFEHHALDEQLYELLALLERLCGVLFDFGYAFSERNEPGVRGPGEFCMLASL
jgi:hypothetical protein